jgi:hypothetical protein
MGLSDLQKVMEMIFQKYTAGCLYIQVGFFLEFLWKSMHLKAKHRRQKSLDRNGLNSTMRWWRQLLPSGTFSSGLCFQDSSGGRYNSNLGENPSWNFLVNTSY